MNKTTPSNLIGVKQIGKKLHLALSYRHVEAESFLIAYYEGVLHIFSTDTNEVQDTINIQAQNGLTVNQTYANNILHITLSQ